MGDRGEEYWQLVRQWRDIIARPLSDEDKQSACLAVLRNDIRGMAISRVKQPNAPLRFYADMVSLRARLQPTFANDDLGRLAIRPLFLIVNKWVHENQSHRRRVTPGET